MARLRAIIVTPERKLVDQSADGVVVPLFDGELGSFAPPRAADRETGRGRVANPFGTESCGPSFVDGGFVEVLNDVVSVMTSRAQAVEELDVGSRGRGPGGQRWRTRPVGDDMLLSREEAAAKARSLLRTARRAASRR